MALQLREKAKPFTDWLEQAEEEEEDDDEEEAEDEVPFLIYELLVVTVSKLII